MAQDNPGSKKRRMKGASWAMAAFFAIGFFPTKMQEGPQIASMLAAGAMVIVGMRSRDMLQGVIRGVLLGIIAGISITLAMYQVNVDHFDKIAQTAARIAQQNVTSRPADQPTTQPTSKPDETSADTPAKTTAKEHATVRRPWISPDIQPADEDSPEATTQPTGYWVDTPELQREHKKAGKHAVSNTHDMARYAIPLTSLTCALLGGIFGHMASRRRKLLEDQWRQ